jgi:hypothetical protein
MTGAKSYLFLFPLLLSLLSQLLLLGLGEHSSTFTSLLVPSIILCGTFGCVLLLSTLGSLPLLVGQGKLIVDGGFCGGLCCEVLGGLLTAGFDEILRKTLLLALLSVLLHHGHEATDGRIFLFLLIFVAIGGGCIVAVGSGDGLA